MSAARSLPFRSPKSTTTPVRVVGPSAYETRNCWVDAVTPATWLDRPTLRMDRAAEQEAAREVAEFHRTGARADLNTNWKKPLIAMGVLSVAGFPERDR